MERGLRTRPCVHREDWRLQLELELSPSLFQMYSGMFSSICVLFDKQFFGAKRRGWFDLSVAFSSMWLQMWRCDVCGTPLRSDTIVWCFGLQSRRKNTYIYIFWYKLKVFFCSVIYENNTQSAVLIFDQSEMFVKETINQSNQKAYKYIRGSSFHDSDVLMLSFNKPVPANSGIPTSVHCVTSAIRKNK